MTFSILRPFFCCWLLAGFFAGAEAQILAAAEPRTSAGKASTGNVDLDRSRTYVLIGVSGLGHEHGAEGKLSAGNLKLGAARNGGSIEFNMASFVCETADSRKYVGLEGDVDPETAAQVTANMRGKDVLDVARYPDAVFEIDSALPLRQAKSSDPVVYQLAGRLTMHGTTRPLSLKAQADEAEGMVRLRTRFTILQTQFGIKPYKKLFGAVGVADRLDIWGEIWLAPDRR